MPAEKSHILRDIGCVIGVRRDRLGARLCAMINAWRLGEALGAPVRFGWPADEGIGWADAKALFDPGFLETKILDPDSLAAVESGLTHPFESNVACAEANGRRYLLVDKPFGDLDFAALGIDAPQRSWSDSAAALNPFDATLRRRAQVLAAQFGDPDTILHVRRGDLADPNAPTFARFVARYIPYSYYAAYVERHAPQGELPVFSDCPHAAERLRGAGIQARQMTFDHSDLSACQRDLVELLLLARPRVSVGGKSAFRETAAQLGGAANVRLFDAFDAATRRELMYLELARDDLAPGEAISCRVNLARQEFDAGEVRTALSIMEHAIKIDPAATGPRKVFARLLDRAGDLTDAQRQRARATGKAP